MIERQIIVVWVLTKDCPVLFKHCPNKPLKFGLFSSRNWRIHQLKQREPNNNNKHDYEVVFELVDDKVEVLASCSCKPVELKQVK